MTRSSISLFAALALLAGSSASYAQSGGAGGGGRATGSAGSSSMQAVPPPGINSAGTAQSSGSGITTGSVRRNSAGTDAAVAAEDRAIGRKIKSICRGC